MVEERLNNLIMKIGEKSTASLESNLLALAKVLYSDMNEHKVEILDIIGDCVIEMPEKVTVYSTLVGLINASSYTVGGEILDLLLKRLKNCLRDEQWENGRCIVRFISDLVNCHVLNASSLLSFFKIWIDTATQEKNTSQARRDMLVYYVLSSLPWVGRALYEKKELEFQNLLKNIQIYLNNRSRNHVKALSVWKNSEPHAQEDYLDCLWAQIERLENSNWLERSIIRPYESFDSILCEALQHNIPNFIIPRFEEIIKYPYPKVVFRMFDYTDVPQNGPVLPGTHAIERYIIEEQLGYIIDLLYSDKKLCAMGLLDFTCRSRAPLNYMIVEVVFSKLFELPQNKHLEVFYCTLLMELCKLQPSAMPLVLAQATELLFERINTMDVSCIVRFTSWFSHHLSNFQFRWSWEDWAAQAKVDETSNVKTTFIKEVFIKCMKLSYYQRIIDFTPDSLSYLRPKKPEPHFKYGDNILSKKLTEAIRAKAGTEEVIDILEDVPSDFETTDENSFSEQNKVQILVATLLNLGSKSISHSVAALTKFHEVIQALADSEDSQICVLNAIRALWQDDEQKICLLVDKLVKTQLVDALSVTAWIFSDQMQQDFTRFYLWDILHTTINRFEQHVANLKEKYIQGRNSRNAIDTMEGTEIHDIPTSGQLNELEEEWESGKSNLKNIFLVIFQRFVICLSERLSKYESINKNCDGPWYFWTIGRLKEVFMKHETTISSFSRSLNEFVFTSDIEKHILEVFNEFLALRN